MNLFFHKIIFASLCIFLFALEIRANDEDKIPLLPKYVIHRVTAGDNLYLLSGYYYGNARLWEKIFNANREALKNPNILETGQELRIPVEPEWFAKYSIEEFRKITEKAK